MDAIKDPDCESVVVMSSAQVGKTEIVNNVVGYHVDQDPCPILVLQPTLEMAETWSKDRLAPMLRDTPCLTGRVKDPQTRNSGNTLRHKSFPGGHITMAGANSPASLASRPIRALLCDEVDRYPASAGTEGDPVNLAKKRTTTFWNRRILEVSTPTIKGASRIESAYNESTMERYHVPCHACGETQHLQWAQVKWDDEDAKTARYECEMCGAAWTDAQRWGALRDGEWIAEKESTSRGFHLNEIYSPWVTLADMVASFLEAKKLPETLKTWVNTSLGETWEESGETVEPDVLYRTRREHYPEALPADALVITAGIDQQKGWLACETVAWSESLESWSLEYQEFQGGTDDPKSGAWEDLRAYLREATWLHQSGEQIGISAAAVDTHGPYTTAAYKFCKSLQRSKVYAIRGAGGMGKPVISALSRSNEAKVPLYTLGVDTLKSRLYQRLYEVDAPGAGYCHFPVNFTEQYFDGLASEKAVTRYSRGRAEVRWEPKPGTRQEPLDCRVYAMAALEISRPRWNIKRTQLSPGKEDVSAPDAAGATAAKRGRRNTRRKYSATNWR